MVAASEPSTEDAAEAEHAAEGGPRAEGPAPGGAPTSPPPRQVEVSTRTIWRLIASVLATLLLLAVVRTASTLLAMVGLSFFFGLALDPAVRSLHARFEWRRGTAVGVVYAAGLAFVVFLVAVLVPAVGQMADQISANADEWLSDLNDWTQSAIGVPIPGGDAAAAAPQAGELVGSFTGEPFGRVLGFASAGVALVFNMATIAMFTFYFAADAPRIQRTVLRLFSPRHQERIGWTWDQAIIQTGGYFYSRLLLMLINGTGFFVTMALVGVDIGLALGLAIFAGFVSEFIPAIGTYIGGAVPVALTLALQGLVPALVVLAYVLVYQQVENYYLSPKISADTMSLNGGVAFFAALAGGAIAGPIGAFVALPVAALMSSSVSNYGRSYEVVYSSTLDDRTMHDDTTGDDMTTVNPAQPDGRANRRG